MIQGRAVNDMRKLLTVALFLLVLHTTYYDLTTGTLATYDVSNDIEAPPEENAKTPYVIHNTKAGDTVLSLVEKENGTIPVSIDTIVHDFETLNKIPPTQIQIGQQYKIPTYTDTSSQ
ncbi:hypothetical protein ABFG93_18950 [Pseudalkalibacillus hwajinpoensis]|uniref:hypothetical protein n=1 Tax=Guptibacillus hwajinpoensis TaxID=208199 RepID=UPI00325AB793